jgi:hypothetical protein
LRADDAAMTIIDGIKEIDGRESSKTGTRKRNEDDKSESEATDDETVTASNVAANCARVLVFLWAIANGMGAEVSLADPPEVPITDAMMQQIHQDLMGTPVTQIPAPAGVPTGMNMGGPHQRFLRC